MKFCKFCGKVKAYDNFYIREKNADGYECRCKQCQSKYYSEHHFKNRHLKAQKYQDKKMMEKLERIAI